jgi:hypothetical protein
VREEWRVASGERKVGSGQWPVDREGGRQRSTPHTLSTTLMNRPRPPSMPPAELGIHGLNR